MSGIDDENPRWIEAISQMQRVEKLLPDEPLWSVGAAQNLADVIVRIEGHLSAEDRAVLIGIGGMLVREGNNETMAGLEAFLALRKLGGRDDG